MPIQDILQSLLWTMRLRWLIVSLLFLTFLIFRNALPPQIFMIVVICCLIEYVHNIFLFFIKFSARPFLQYLLYLSPIIDMLILVMGISWAGRIALGSSTLYLIPIIYSIPIITTSVMLSMSIGLLIAGIASILFTALAFYGFTQGVVAPFVLLMVIEKIVYFFVVAILSGYLAHLIRQKAKELQASHLRLEEKNKELLSAQQQLIQSEKMASIAQISVSLNHEINNPLTSVLADIQFALLKIKEEMKDNKALIISCLRTAEQEALRIRNIMQDLRNITDPVVEDYIPGISMINIKESQQKHKRQ